nr:translation initiation factor IF-2-like [Oryctolagus cuniculus]
MDDHVTHITQTHETVDVHTDDHMTHITQTHETVGVHMYNHVTHITQTHGAVGVHTDDHVTHITQTHEMPSPGRARGREREAAARGPLPGPERGGSHSGHAARPATVPGGRQGGRGRRREGRAGAGAGPPRQPRAREPRGRTRPPARPRPVPGSRAPRSRRGGRAGEGLPRRPEGRSARARAGGRRPGVRSGLPGPSPAETLAGWGPRCGQRCVPRPPRGPGPWPGWARRTRPGLRGGPSPATRAKRRWREALGAAAHRPLPAWTRVLGVRKDPAAAGPGLRDPRGGRRRPARGKGVFCSQARWALRGRPERTLPRRAPPASFVRFAAPHCPAHARNARPCGGRRGNNGERPCGPGRVRLRAGALGCGADPGLLGRGEDQPPTPTRRVREVGLGGEVPFSASLLHPQRPDHGVGETQASWAL